MALFGVDHHTHDMLALSHERLKIDAGRIAAKYLNVLKKHNRLIDLINSKGGEVFLNNAVMPGKVQPQLSAEDIKRLIQLCHPDKHDGKDAAVEMTRKLLSLRT